MVRVSKEEKILAVDLSKAEGQNVSEYFRFLMNDYAKSKRLEGQLDRLENLLKQKR